MREEPATADDIAKMGDVLKQAIAAGAIGFACSRTDLHVACGNSWGVVMSDRGLDEMDRKILRTLQGQPACRSPISALPSACRRRPSGVA